MIDDLHRDGLSPLGLQPPPVKGPAILIYDIETAPALAYVWDAWQTNIIETKTDGYLLSFAYKWLGQRKVDFVSIFQDPDFTPGTTNDFWVAERLAALFNKADVVVAHNGDKFDRRKANTFFLKNGIGPPSPYQTIDTLKVARREFYHIKNSLDDLARVHELGRKEATHGFALWLGCMEGNPAHWKRMERYNRQDVVLLEKLYKTLLPWMGAPGKPAHPNLGFWRRGDKVVCPRCGGTKMWRNGTHRTLVSEFQTFQCQSCKGYSRARKRNSQRNESEGAAVKVV